MLASGMENPYQASVRTESAPASASGSASQPTILALSATKPWVRACAIMGFLGAGMMVLSGAFISTGGAFATIPQSPQPAAPGMAYLGIVYIALAVLYILPAVKLRKYGGSIRDLVASGSNADLERALDHHRGFWKFVGIIIIVSIVMFVLFFITAVVMGIAAAGAMSPR